MWLPTISLQTAITSDGTLIMLELPIERGKDKQKSRRMWSFEESYKRRNISNIKEI